MSRNAGSRRSRLHRSLAVVGIAAATVVGFAPRAVADTPPGFTAPDPASGLWVAFTVDNPVATGRSSFGPVTLTRVGNMSGTDLQAAFSNWDVQPDPPNPDKVGWPSTFSAGSVQLQRADTFCDYTSTTCHYTVGQAGTFSAEGGVPLDGSSQPDPGQFPPSQTITLPPAMMLHVGFSPDLHPTPGAVGQPGHVTLDATTFTSDECTTCGPLTYHWVVQTEDATTPTQTFTSDIGPQVQLDINQDGTYCVQLTVTAGDGVSQSTPTCASGNPNGAYVHRNGLRTQDDPTRLRLHASDTGADSDATSDTARGSGRRRRGRVRRHHVLEPAAPRASGAFFGRPVLPCRRLALAPRLLQADARSRDARADHDEHAEPQGSARDRGHTSGSQRRKRGTVARRHGRVRDGGRWLDAQPASSAAAARSRALSVLGSAGSGRSGLGER